MNYVMLYFFLPWATLLSCAQSNEHRENVLAWQQSQNEEFKDPVRTPLMAEDRTNFQGHNFFPIDKDYRVTARFESTPESPIFLLATSKGTEKRYRRLGKLHFILKEKAITIEAYIPVQGFGMAALGQHVFIPISDQTNGNTTYDAGRYLHIDGVPASREWILDFNKLYNPFCAYNANFECPIVPEPNQLDIPIEAGIKGF